MEGRRQCCLGPEPNISSTSDCHLLVQAYLHIVHRCVVAGLFLHTKSGRWECIGRDAEQCLAAGVGHGDAGDRDCKEAISLQSPQHKCEQSHIDSGLARTTATRLPVCC